MRGLASERGAGRLRKRPSPRRPAILGEEVTESTVDCVHVDGARIGEQAIPRHIGVNVRSVADLELDQRNSSDGYSSFLRA